MAVRGGFVVGVGAGPSGCDDRIGPETRVVELRGRACLPGFHDAHTHLLGGALARDALDLREARGDEDLARAVAARVAARGADAWVLGRGWDADAFPGGRWPDPRALDRVAPRTPVLLRRRDGHAAVANAEALRRAGVGAATPDPPGGRLGRDAAGAPTGVLLELAAVDLVARAGPARPGADDVARALAPVVAGALARGITSLQDDPSYDPELPAAAGYAALAAAGGLPVRVSLWRRLGTDEATLRAQEAALAAALAQGPAGVARARVAFGALKGFLDGSLGSRTAWLEAPYADAPDTVGVAVASCEEVVAGVVAAQAAGRQVALHAIGDAAAALALDAVEAAAAAHGLEPTRGRRHRLEHAQLLRPGDDARALRLGVVASVQPVHLAHDLAIVRARLGPARAARAYPWASLLRRGGLLALGTDYPVEPLGPLPGLFWAVTRGGHDAPLDPAEALTLAEALEAHTWGPARAAHQDPWLGRLAPGFAADLCVLSGDPFALPPEAWGDLRVDLTVVDGEVVYEAAG